ncbi:arginyltransferase 1-like protein [Naegleria gruberi]|uniref:Arginyl-tRNA--protein transferase 1 n=1 Tax=Naegleria gruberi TaxID=5762 RepID=D2V1S2_NAEGR|nr:arginyltransferase 1-like protein [Naegleria gruberi]EFC49361.1 arginyltransferase 1-like protein [Naegleria gruberi]|eukprot:XP_002682105.1 arginyltransferase 1-like protein [Naegleria gruberi strain NEG-M]
MSQRNRSAQKQPQQHYCPIIFHGEDAHSCGYCKTLDESGKNVRTPDTSVSVGFHVYQLPANIYEKMMYHNMRRSGVYYYQPQNDKTCCPQYAIRLNCLEFKMNKNQKKVMKKMDKYLETGTFHHEESKENNNSSTSEKDPKKRKFEDENSIVETITNNFRKLLKENMQKIVDLFEGCNNTEKLKEQLEQVFEKQRIQTNQKNPNLLSTPIAFSIFGLQKKFGCKEIEKKELAEKIVSLLNEHSWEETYHISIKIEENGYINIELLDKQLKKNFEQSKQKESTQKEAIHPRLHEIKTVLMDSEYREEEYKLYQKYQKIVHKEDDSTPKGYQRFLCDSSLLNVDTDSTSDKKPLKGYGTFHLQYRLDNKLIAVSVLDVLPTGLSSVYFFYDADYSDLSLGIYSALTEIEMIKKESEKFPNFKYYYLGFYIHSCQKMKYKGQYSPSEILCFDTYTWVPLNDELKSKLEENKYFTFNEQAEKKRGLEFEENDGLSIFFNREIIPSQLLNMLPLSTDARKRIAEFKKVFGKDLLKGSGFAFYIDEEDLDTCE